MKFGLAMDPFCHTYRFFVVNLMPLSIKVDVRNWILVQLNVYFLNIQKIPKLNS